MGTSPAVSISGCFAAFPSVAVASGVQRAGMMPCRVLGLPTHPPCHRSISHSRHQLWGLEKPPMNFAFVPHR